VRRALKTTVLCSRTTSSRVNFPSRPHRLVGSEALERREHLVLRRRREAHPSSRSTSSCTAPGLRPWGGGGGGGGGTIMPAGSHPAAQGDDRERVPRVSNAPSSASWNGRTPAPLRPLRSRPPRARHEAQLLRDPSRRASAMGDRRRPDPLASLNARRALAHVDRAGPAKDTIRSARPAAPRVLRLLAFENIVLDLAAAVLEAVRCTSVL